MKRHNSMDHYLDSGEASPDFLGPVYTKDLGCQITAFLEPNRHKCRQENNENKRQIQRKTKSIVKSLAPKMQ